MRAPGTPLEQVPERAPRLQTATVDGRRLLPHRPPQAETESHCDEPLADATARQALETDGG